VGVFGADGKARGEPHIRAASGFPSKGEAGRGGGEGPDFIVAGRSGLRARLTIF